MSFYSISHFIQHYYPEYYSLNEYPACQCVAFNKVSGDRGVFSNFAPTPISLGGVVFRNVEQLYQLMKFKDSAAVTAVYEANNPKFSAKHWEKSCRRDDWGRILVDALKFCLQKKFEQSEAFRVALSDSRPFYIVEDQTSFRKRSADTWGAKLVGDTFVVRTLWAGC